jgi:crotonobetaine/carnitine-CoA ligase
MRLVGHELEETTIGGLVRARAALGDKPLIWIDDEMLTYGDAHESSDRYANALASLGVVKGDVVATYAYNSVDHVRVWFACAKLGAIWAPINVSLRADDLEYTLRDTTAKILIIDAELLEHYHAVRDRPAFAHQILLGTRETAAQAGMTHSSILAEGSTAAVRTDVLPSDPVAIVYTGGSSGLPKGVLIPHLNELAVALRYQDVAQARSTDVMYECGHLFHSGGQQLGVMGPLYCGMTSVMNRWFSVSRLWDIVNRHGANLVHVPGPMLGPIMDRTPADGGPDHPVRLALGVGTGQVRREIRDAFERRFGFPLLEVYAQTEMGVLVCSQRVNERRPGSSGHSYGWATVQIVDEHDRPLPAGVEGEIVTRPTEPYTFMLGYHNKPEMTAQTWRNLWHHTGDLGYLDEDGFLFFKGRKAFWIRRLGENVSSFEVEKTIGELPAVLECAVVGVPSDIGDEDIKVYVIAREAMTIAPREIVEWCAARIASFKVPRYVEIVGELPRTAVKNDIDRTKLKALGKGNAWDREAAGMIRSPQARHRQ